MTPEKKDHFRIFIEQLNQCVQLQPETLSRVIDGELHNSEVLQFLLWAMANVLQEPKARFNNAVIRDLDQKTWTQICHPNDVDITCISEHRQRLVELAVRAFLYNSEFLPNTWYDLPSARLIHTLSDSEVKMIHLGNPTHYIFLYFLLNPNTVITVEEVEKLILKVKGPVTPNTLLQQVSDLRAKLERIGLPAKDYLINLPERGYVLFSFDALKNLPSEEYIQLNKDVIFIPEIQCVVNISARRKHFLSAASSAVLLALTHSPGEKVRRSHILDQVSAQVGEKKRLLDPSKTLLTAAFANDKVSLSLVGFDLRRHFTVFSKESDPIYIFKP